MFIQNLLFQYILKYRLDLENIGNLQTDWNLIRLELFHLCNYRIFHTIIKTNDLFLDWIIHLVTHLIKLCQNYFSSPDRNHILYMIQTQFILTGEYCLCFLGFLFLFFGFLVFWNTAAIMLWWSNRLKVVGFKICILPRTN